MINPKSPVLTTKVPVSVRGLEFRCPSQNLVTKLSIDARMEMQHPERNLGLVVEAVTVTSASQRFAIDLWSWMGGGRNAKPMTGP